MHELLAPDALIDRFRTAVTRRVAAEKQIEVRFESGEDPEEARYRSLLQAAEQRASSTMDAVHAEYAEVVSQFDEYESTTRQEILGKYGASESRAINEYDRRIARIEDEYREKDWVVDSLIDEQADKSPQRLLDQMNAAEARTREYQIEQIRDLRTRMQEAADYWRLDVPDDPRTYPDMFPASTKAAAVDEVFQEAVVQTDNDFNKLKKLRLARWTRGPRSVLWFLLAATVVTVPAGLLIDHNAVGVTADKWWPIVGALGACFGFAFTAILTGTGYGSRKAAWRQLSESYLNAIHQHQGWCMRADDEYGTAREKLLAEIDERSDLKSSKQQKLASRRAEKELDAAESRDAVIAEAASNRDETLATLSSELVEQRQTAEDVFHQRRGIAESRGAEAVAEASGALQRYLAGRDQESNLLRTQMCDGWNAAIQSVNDEVAERHEVARVPEWSSVAASSWAPASSLPKGLRLGDLVWRTSEIEHAESQRPELTSLADEVVLPALLDFPGNPSVVFRGKGAAARSVAEQTLQSFLLRAFTSIPPSQMRVTLLDPIGLGEPFSPFMHLTDIDERLVAGRIWTEPQQIEAQLADLTEHMENVLQTYLRGDFPTIEAYNEMAGEVAEPYRFLVVNGFPHRFTEPAVRRLLSIASSGPRCGVFLAMYHDTGLAPISNLPLDALDEGAAVLKWSSATDSYVVKRQDDDPAKADDTIDNIGSTIGELEESVERTVESDKPQAKPVTLVFRPIPPPAPSEFSAIVGNVGNASRHAGRVEVSFSKIAPLPDKHWASDSRRGLDIPLGRAGATKLQHARFGRGTAQHMLVAGKTGSGKSTFLHALITNAALHYSPRELRFFLIDFKKGVEFKAYAPSTDTGGVCLPHADVIAVESEREFGVSALKRLDELLNERGEMFRAAGVQDVGQFRDENPAVDMPRVMLLIDEFQEFFVEDDALAQQASLLLDRLIRQGRAFGVHCVLGSQTLGGAYSLARSTLGQIGIRVALQCSEADAHLIMAEDNTAARLLARPGEAIYNDAGGLVEGNQPFQVAYLTDEQRVCYLDDLTKEANSQGMLAGPPVVFEGNRPAVLTHELIASSHESPLGFAVGDAVEIKPPTSIPLGRRSGGNVLVVGTSSHQTRGLLVAAAAQLTGTTVEGPKPRATVHVLHSPDVDEGVWVKTVEELELPVNLVTSTGVVDLLTSLDAERERRDGVSADDESHVLIVDGLHNFRQLRRPEDDYGFGGGGGLASPFGSNAETEAPPADPGKLFSNLLNEGPERGLFVVASVDGYPAADRALGRKGLREFGARVLFRLSANDSSSLIDTPAASKLDSLRGLVYDDATGDLEKFRPFAVPTEEDLDRLSGKSPEDEAVGDEPADAGLDQGTEPAEPAISAQAASGPEVEPSGQESGNRESSGGEDRPDDDGSLPDASLDDFLVH